MKIQFTDEELIQRFIGTRQHQYFDEIYCRYITKVLRRCHAFAETSFEAEDMAQEVFVRVFNGVDSFRGHARFSTWLQVLTNNYCTDRLRYSIKQAKSKSEYLTTLDLVEEPSEAGSQLTFLDGQLHCLQVAMQQLPDLDQQLLIRKYQLRQPVLEIALSENSNLSAVKMRLLRARKRLRLAYQKVCIASTIY